MLSHNHEIEMTGTQLQAESRCRVSTHYSLTHLNHASPLNLILHSMNPGIAT